MNTIQRDQYDAIDCAMINASFVRILYRDLDTSGPEGRTCLSQQLQTGFDRLLGGALVLALHTAKVLVTLDVQYEDGVFAYDHLESSSDPAKDMERFINNEKTAISLPTFVFNKMTHKDWYEVSENHVPPQELTAWVKEWLTIVGLDKKEENA